MPEYDRAQATAQRLIAQKGFVATIRAVDTPTDPVFGFDQIPAATREVDAVRLRIDASLFTETLVEQASCMLLCDGPVQVGEKWIDGAAERPVLAVESVMPDNASHIISKALIRG